MPNWVENKVTVEGPERRLRSLVLAVEHEGRAFSCEAIAPMPKAVRDYNASKEPVPTSASSGSTPQELLNAVAFATNLGHRTEPPREPNTWSEKHWGSKWDTDSCRLANARVGFRAFEFLTAWSPPTRAVDTLASLFPEVKIELASLEEGFQFAALTTWDEGHRTNEMNLQWDPACERFQHIHERVRGIGATE